MPAAGRDTRPLPGVPGSVRHMRQILQITLVLGAALGFGFARLVPGAVGDISLTSGSTPSPGPVPAPA